MTVRIYTTPGLWKLTSLINEGFKNNDFPEIYCPGFKIYYYLNVIVISEYEDY